MAPVEHAKRVAQYEKFNRKIGANSGERSPLMELQSARLAITPCCSEGIENGVVVDMVGAKTQHKKKEGSQMFPGNPPPSPYL